MLEGFYKNNKTKFDNLRKNLQKFINYAYLFFILYYYIAMFAKTLLFLVKKFIVGEDFFKILQK